MPAREERLLILKGYGWMLLVTALGAGVVFSSLLAVRAALAGVALFFGWWLYIARSRSRLRWVGQALTDRLTGLYSRRYLFPRLMEEVRRAERYGGPLAVAILDLDDFKAINDQQGHLRGDEVLRAFGSAVRAALREHDVGFRFGGDEFVLVLPGVSAEDVGHRLERISRRFAEPVTWSAGYACYPDDTRDPQELLALADERLLAQKRIRCVGHGPKDSSTKADSAG
jgi:diguanylate cyclase (GGDEF)-like protein